MKTVNVETLLPKIIPFVSGCNDTIAKIVLAEAARTFARETDVITETQGYDIADAPEYGRIPEFAVDKENFLPLHFVARNEDKPNRKVYVTYSLLPTANLMPEAVIDRFHEAITSQALFMLYSMPGKPWTAPDMAQLYLQKYRIAAGDAMRDNNTGGAVFDQYMICCEPGDGGFIGSQNVPATVIGTDTSDGNITPNTVLAGYAGYAKGEKVVGNIQSVTASLKKNIFTVPMGYVGSPVTLSIPEVTATLDKNTATVPVGYIGEEQKLTVPVANITNDGEYVTVPVGYVELERKFKVGGSSGVNVDFVTATASDILSGKTGTDKSGNPVYGNIQTVTASLSGNVVNVPKGYIAEEQTLTVAEAKAPEVDGNVVTIYPGYVATEQTVTVENTGDDVNWSEVTATASDIRQGTAIVTESGVLNGTLPTRQTSDIVVNGNQVAFPYGIYDSSNSVSVGTVKAAETITPGTVDQTIPADTYLSGDLTVKGDANLIPENIAAGVTVFGVEGIRSGDGGGETVEYGYINENGMFQGIDLSGDAPADVGTAENVDLKMFLTGKPLPENSVTLDLSFITATASDILAGKLGTDVNGKPVNGAIQTVTASLSRNTVTVPMGYIAEEQTLTVAEMDEPSLSGNVVTIPVGYNKYQLKYSVGTAKGAATITPGTVDQTIPAKTYLTGDLTVKGDDDLLPENIINGKTIFGVTGTHKTDYSMDAYKCAAVHGLYEKECVIIQDPIHNGFYTGVYELSKSRYTTDENGNKQYAYVNGRETAPGIWHNWYYHYNEFDKKWGVSKDEFNPETGLEYYGSIGTSWTDKEGNVRETMTCEAAVITKIDPNAYHTWDGYKATIGEDGCYTLEENLTTGLTYGTSYPETGKIYSADGTMEIKPAPFGNMTEGLVFYAPLQGGISSAEIGGKLINNGAVAEEYGADFTGNAVIMPEKNISIGTRDDSDFTLIFEVNIYDCADNAAVYPIRIGDDAWDQFLPHIEKIGNDVFLVFPSVTNENGRYLNDRSFDRWFNVAVVRQNKRYYYFMSGSACSYIDYAQGISEPKLYIGSCNENGTDGFNGRIKDILIYDRALTTAEINFIENRYEIASACNRDKPYVYTVSGSDDEENNGDYWANGNIYNGKKVYINKHARAIYFYDGRWRFDYLPPHDTLVSLNGYYCHNSISNGKTPTEGEWIRPNGEKIGLTVTEYQG